jgi:hypothetical protein
MSKLKRNLRYHEGVPAILKKRLENRFNSWPPIDRSYSKDVGVLFNRGSHHRNISVIFITQNVFHQGRNCRDISLNTIYLVLSKNVRDKSQFTCLANQVNPENNSGLFRAYLDEMKRAHVYLLLDISQDSEDRHLFRRNVFPALISSEDPCCDRRWKA